MNKTREDIFQFHDFRSYLLAHAEMMKKKNARWSFGAWAKHLELKATSSLTKILQGKRNPGPEITGRLIRYFEFTQDEERYFRELVQSKRLKRPEEGGLSTITIPSSKIDEAREYLREIELEFRQRFQDSSGDAVLYLDLQLVQVAQKPTRH